MNISKAQVSVTAIVKAWLVEHGYDGLCSGSPGGCGCSIDDLGPCTGGIADCAPAYARIAAVEDVEFWDCDVGDKIFTTHRGLTPEENAWHLQENKGQD